ncbi:GtrA family protein [Staphylococcus sp. IVB6246]|uniref:GtrA family protein n=1 Tax=unclassified Staphylococcus TaxID=91994 RepID=UPI0021CF8899|nr:MULTISPECIES: GtrA family protein [unclassified Staphylococcus]UXR70377.1 GtrA family protein [Staphylococcus sp. IVB6246]UXR72443.1 GtrA family protein [Staphylococcus sp. IVB6240]UXR74746.1 GtrA family protein [Staphylococcus sp. IVB6238]
MKNERLFEIIRFIIVGGLNTVNYYIVYLLLLHVFHIQYLISHIIGFIVAFIISYYLNCYFVYKVKPTLKKFLAFPLTQVVNMGVQTLLIYLFVDFLDFNESIAPFVGLIVTIPITYVLSKFILTKRF